MDRFAGFSPFRPVPPGDIPVSIRTGVVSAEIPPGDRQEQFCQLVQGHLHEFTDVHTGKGDGQCFWLQSFSVTDRTQLTFHKTGDAFSHQRALRAGEGMQHITSSSGEGPHITRRQFFPDGCACLFRTQSRVDRHRGGCLR